MSEKGYELKEVKGAMYLSMYDPTEVIVYSLKSSSNIYVGFRDKEGGNLEVNICFDKKLAKQLMNRLIKELEVEKED